MYNVRKQRLSHFPHICLIHKDVFELNAQVAMLMFNYWPYNSNRNSQRKHFLFLMAYGEEKKYTQFKSPCVGVYISVQEKPGTNSKNRQPLYTIDRHYLKRGFSLMLFTYFNITSLFLHYNMARTCFMLTNITFKSEFRFSIQTKNNNMHFFSVFLWLFCFLLFAHMIKNFADLT